MINARKMKTRNLMMTMRVVVQGFGAIDAG